MTHITQEESNMIHARVLKKELLERADKWVNNQGRDTQYLIERAISENIIRRNKRQFTWRFSY